MELYFLFCFCVVVAFLAFAHLQSQATDRFLSGGHKDSPTDDSCKSDSCKSWSDHQWVTIDRTWNGEYKQECAICGESANTSSLS